MKPEHTEANTETAPSVGSGALLALPFRIASNAWVALNCAGVALSASAIRSAIESGQLKPGRLPRYGIKTHNALCRIVGVSETVKQKWRYDPYTGKAIFR